jgi:hypothetical protein
VRCACPEDVTDAEHAALEAPTNRSAKGPSEATNGGDEGIRTIGG